MKKKKIEWDKMQLPIVKNVSPRTIAQDIKGFDPNNPKDVAEWDEYMSKLWSPIKKEFAEKGIPWPKIVYDTNPGPITYGIKTTDETGNVLHSTTNYESDK